MEFFCPPRVAPLLHEQGFVATKSFDLRTGWDCSKEAGRKSALMDIAEHCPKVVLLRPPCTMFSPLQTTNWGRMDHVKCEEKVRKGLVFLDFSIWAMLFQHKHKRGFIFEHPDKASSWTRGNLQRLAAMDGVYCAEFDQCM
eukprot:6792237-Pyramimonas_sp.AAC.1